MPEDRYTGDGKQASWAGFSTEEMLKLMHHPVVVAHCVKMAQEVIGNTSLGANGYSIVLQNRPETVRPRAYVVPNSKGIRAELKDGDLLKAALGMSGK